MGWYQTMNPKNHDSKANMGWYQTLNPKNHDFKANNFVRKVTQQ